MTVATQDPQDAGVHEPQPVSTAKDDPRFPWKAKGTRKPLIFWDRVKFLVLFVGFFQLLTWNTYIGISPLGSWNDAQQQVLAEQPWLLWLTVIEVVRQVHFFISEHSAKYHKFWSERVFGRTTRWYEKRFNPWNRYRIARIAKWLLFIALLSVLLGKIVNASPVVGLFKAPALLVQALPFILQIVLFMAIAILQFVAMFWFLSRGGVETFFPDDIETRFSDVWGQDHVLERVKENVILLDDPESIEAKGGHVPSGILLWGPPGTGKTLMAQAVAGETGKPFVLVEPGAFTAMFFGVGIMKVKSLFRKLRKLALRYGGVIVFLDEADTLGSRSRSVQPQPGAGAVPAFMSASSAGCSGFSHVSTAAQWELADWSRRSATSSDEAQKGPWYSKFVVGGGMGGGSGGFDGTLQALLTELSGLNKPRGFINRVVRKALGMRPKPPPKYRILVMMASNLPQALDPALLRPGRIDRMYKVTYPSKAGRLQTFAKYLDRTKHELTPEQLDKIATITPYATGASIQDLVNEALINAIRDGREVITWKDLIKAKHFKALGESEGVDYVDAERHATAVHEACHAVMAWKTRHHLDIDIATIEKGADYLGMVSSIPPEERFTQWRSEYESDILVSLASLAGEKMFYGGDNSSGVSGDLMSATYIAGLMESRWGMGTGISALPALQDLGIQGGMPEDGKPKGGGGGIGFGTDLGPKKEDRSGGGAAGQRVEFLLARLLVEAEDILAANRAAVLALAHALETHKTLAGEDVVAVIEGTQGPLVDGTPYRDPAFIGELEEYHEAALEAHRRHRPLAAALPQPVGVIRGELVDEPTAASDDSRWAAAAPAWTIGNETKKDAPADPPTP